MRWTTNLSPLEDTTGSNHCSEASCYTARRTRSGSVNWSSASALKGSLVLTLCYAGSARRPRFTLYGFSWHCASGKMSIRALLQPSSAAVVVLVVVSPRWGVTRSSAFKTRIRTTCGSRRRLQIRPTDTQKCSPLHFVTPLVHQTNRYKVEDKKPI